MQEEESIDVGDAAMQKLMHDDGSWPACLPSPPLPLGETSSSAGLREGMNDRNRVRDEHWRRESRKGERAEREGEEEEEALPHFIYHKRHGHLYL